MFYGKMIAKLMRETKNPVNSMYLHEINIKWKNFEKFAQADKDSGNEQLVKSLNDFVTALSNKKFKYNPSTKNGFKKDSPIFSATYLDDLISVIMNRNDIINNKGIVWGHHSFSANIKFNPQSFQMMDKDPSFGQTLSAKFLLLALNMDYQFRIAGKRNFSKHKTVFPLIVFRTFKNVDKEAFRNVEFYASKAKTTFEKSRTIIVTETLEKGFVPDLKSSPVDSVFVLRKQYQTIKLHEISLDVVNMLEEKIKQYLSGEEGTSEDFLNTGIIE